MLAIQSLKCIYDTGARGWAIELVLAAEGDHATHRFDVESAQDAEMLIDAFEDSSASAFDPATGEIVFAYEYADLDLDDEDEEDEAEDGDEIADEQDEKAKG